jgi:hypothetical protein
MCMCYIIRSVGVLPDAVRPAGMAVPRLLPYYTRAQRLLRSWTCAMYVRPCRRGLRPLGGQRVVVIFIIIVTANGSHTPTRAKRVAKLF